MKKTTAIWAAPLFALGMFSAATAAQRPYETVYAMSNSSRGNEVAVLSRGSGGQLTLAGRYSTAGRGSGVGTAAPGDPLGSGRALIVTENGRWLLATNAGSDTVSSFRMVGNRLALSSVVASGALPDEHRATWQFDLCLERARRDTGFAGCLSDGFGIPCASWQ